MLTPADLAAHLRASERTVARMVADELWDLANRLARGIDSYPQDAHNARTSRVEQQPTNQRCTWGSPPANGLLVKGKQRDQRQRRQPCAGVSLYDCRLPVWKLVSLPWRSLLGDK
jgi:hypothetical protein